MVDNDEVLKKDIDIISVKKKMDDISKSNLFAPQN